MGASTAATITLLMLNTTERIIKLPILITYLDNLRTPHNVTTEVAIKVKPLSEVSASRISSASVRGTSSAPINSLILLPAVTVAIILAVIALRKFMRS